MSQVLSRSTKSSAKQTLLLNEVIPVHPCSRGRVRLHLAQYRDSRCHSSYTGHSSTLTISRSAHMPHTGTLFFSPRSLSLLHHHPACVTYNCTRFSSLLHLLIKWPFVSSFSRFLSFSLRLQVKQASTNSVACS